MLFNHITKIVVEYVRSLIQVLIALYLYIGRECCRILLGSVWCLLAANRM